jgi:Na+(H+)/acetate symporter ActP
MQFFILFIGAMVFVFYQFVPPPLFFNPVETERIKNSTYSQDYQQLENDYYTIHDEKSKEIYELLKAIDSDQNNLIDSKQLTINSLYEQSESIRKDAIELIKENNPESDGNDTNYIFLSFVLAFLPAGLIGLVLAAILSASMSSTSAELNALASTTVMDIYKRMIYDKGTEKHYLIVSKMATVFWGGIAIFFALFANRLGSLVEAVNILGSLFYGTILGIFLVAFYIKKIGGHAVFIAAIIAEIVVLALFQFTEVPYLWFNFIGCVLVALLGIIIQIFIHSIRK